MYAKFQRLRNGQKNQVTLNLNQDMVGRIGELKAEWAIDSRTLIIERILEEVFEIQPT
jgi:hypothetical protein